MKSSIFPDSRISVTLFRLFLWNFPFVTSLCKIVNLKPISMKRRSTWLILGLLCSLQVLWAQPKLSVEGNGRFISPASTNVDIHNTDDNTNALVRFGDNSSTKVSLGFNGNEDVFKISTASTLGVDDFTMGLSGLIGINSLPSNHRFLINHNSTSGVDGSAHLTLQESNTTDFARLRFGNLGNDGLWTIATRATDGESIMNFFYNDGTNFGNIMSLDGDLFRVGVNETAPEAYLHIKQLDPGVSALILENDDQTGGEKWGMQIGNTDLDFLFEGVIRGSFSSATGAYTAFPPPAAFTDAPTASQEEVLPKIMQLNPVKIPQEKSKGHTIGLDPSEVLQVNPDWTVKSEDGEQIGINYQQFVALAIKSVQEQQLLIEGQEGEIALLEKEEAEMEARLAKIEAQLAKLAANGNAPSLPTTPSAQPLTPGEFQLQQNRPNPFREETNIEFKVPASANSAKVQLTNTSGEIVRNYSLSKGTNQLNIKSNSLENGTYFYSLIIDGELVDTKQMIIQK